MNPDLTQTTYFKLLQEFLKIIGSSISKEDFNEQEGIVEISTETCILRLIPRHSTENETEPNEAIVEVDLMQLDLENREMNHDRFLILHQLNAVSRLTTGIIAFITEDGMLSVGEIISLSSLNGETFSQKVARVLSAAESLYDAWNQLADLARKNQDSEEVSSILN